MISNHRLTVSSKGRGMGMDARASAHHPIPSPALATLGHLAVVHLFFFLVDHLGNFLLVLILCPQVIADP